MTASGTYTFSPSVGECVLNAFARLQVRNPEVLSEHMFNARMEAGLLQIEWNNKGPSLWTVDLQSTALTQGIASYNVAATTITILDAYITTTVDGQTIDRFIPPISRSEYAQQPNKLTQGPPTVYWFDRLIAPTITLWPVPDGDGPYTLNYYRFAPYA